MQARLLVSAARIALSIAILSLAIVGEPGVRMQAAMRARQLPDPYSVARAVPSGAAQPDLSPAPTLPVAPTRRQVPANGPPTWITAESIHLDAPVLEVGYQVTYLGGAEAVEWQVPDYAAGFHKGTAYPGHPGNTVVSGHNNVAGEVFRRLEDLSIGDRVTLYVGEMPYRYQVVRKEIVRESDVSDEQRRRNAKWILPTSDERLTLVTCWPYTGNSHRLIIVALPAP